MKVLFYIYGVLSDVIHTYDLTCIQYVIFIPIDFVMFISYTSLSPSTHQCEFKTLSNI